MVVRFCGGWTRAFEVAAYLEVLDRMVIPGLTAARGCRGVLVLWRLEGSRAEIATLSLWDSSKSIEGYVGPSVSSCAFHDEEARYLIERDHKARHYEFLARGDFALGAAALFDS